MADKTDPAADRGDLAELRRMLSELEAVAQRLRSELEQVRASRSVEDEARAFLYSIINTMADPVFVKDDEHRWIILNDAYCEFMGYAREELIGKSDFDFFPEQEAKVFWEKDVQVMSSGVANVNEESFTDSRGVTHVILTKKSSFVDHSGRKVLVGVIRDITGQRRVEAELAKYRERLEQLVEARTAELSRANLELQQQIDERRRAEEDKRSIEAQLARQQKLEAVGRLAGGVAHDFNNLLTGIFGHVAIALKATQPGDRAHESLMEISGAARRAATLTRQLLAFSSQQLMAPRVINLNDIVGNLRALLGRIIGEDIELVARIEPELGRVRADPGQIEQVIVNLAVNARDAMPSGGQLTIETSNATLDEGACPASASLPAGAYVILRVTDTGVGMSAELQKRIFEPFFTTRPIGQGTGLGLSTVYGIVQQHGGAIGVQSEPGHGAVFTVYLPRVSEQLDPNVVPPVTANLPRGTEVVLLVEDDNLVREVTAMLLAQLGYRVLTASRGSEALELCQRHTGQIHIVVTDVVMPGMNGRELVERLSGMRPELKALFTSGHAGDAVLRTRNQPAEVEFLPKPYSYEALAKKIRQVIDG
ncbi:MAG: response regulator [Deltaproteobacteria bacterium]|nr:response regulator [Deltaproteobacteria bacterium]